MTLRFAADENFNRKIVTGLRRRADSLDIVRVQDAGLEHAEDPAVLEWAAGDERVLLTHDFATFGVFAYQRVEAGLRMPGVFMVPADMPIAAAIDELPSLLRRAWTASGKDGFNTCRSGSGAASQDQDPGPRTSQGPHALVLTCAKRTPGPTVTG